MSTLITGATRGIGRALFESYVSDGRSVIGTTRGTPDGPDWVTLDVSNPSSISALPSALGARDVDMLICNAGIYSDKGASLDTGYAPDLWADAFAINVTGVFLTIQAMLPKLEAGGQGKIAIISSQMGSTTRAPGGSYVYRASKAAVLNLGRNLAKDLAARGIAVGVYHPGWVQTDMGGASAEITVGESASGLVARFDALSLETTGCFETWDGRPHAY